MIRIRANDETVSFKAIEYICQKYPKEEIKIIIPNTKQQDAEEMRKIAIKYPNIIFSVTGGLDPSKRKFDTEWYQERTIYTPMELSKIISIYREIEKRIDLSWTETQKAMFIYQELCNRMQYSENMINGKDYSRGIGGLIYNKAVCSGFAMIYKEALDRIGIECHYQNRQGSHSWNIAKLDGKYRALELTWDVSNKGEAGCCFYFFNRSGQNFYQNKHHNIKNEDEEYEFPIVEYTDQELIEASRVINKLRIIKIPLDTKKETIAELSSIKINNIECSICKQYNGSIFVKCLDSNKRLLHKAFVRKDGSHFILIPKPEKAYDLNQYIIIEETKDGVQIGIIYSEQNLISIPKEYEEVIANGLLSKERLKRKINDFNGYVGYIGQNKTIYSNLDFEKEKLNVIR